MRSRRRPVSVPRSPLPVPVLVETVAVIALTAAIALLYTHSALVVDSGRDLGNAWQVATGGGVPAYGPRIYGTWSLGPGWYLLLALPFLFGGGVGAAAAWIGVLAAAKIPLAWWFARLRYGAAFALACAAIVALPGWSTAGMLVVAHTAVVESAAWAVLVAYALDVVRARAWTPALVAVLFVCALHAHPTAIVYAPLPALALWRALRAPQDTRRRIGTLVLAITAACAPLLPMLVNEAASGWPQLHASRAYAHDGGLLARIARGPELATGWLRGGPQFVAGHLLPSLPGLHALLTGGAIVALLAAFAATVHACVRGMREPLWLLLWSACALLAIAALRAQTPAYMTFALAPLVAWWIASACVHGAPSMFDALRWPLTVAALLLTVGIHARMRDVREIARIDLPGTALTDVAQPLQPDPLPRFWLAAGDHDRIAAWLCTQPGTTALHGELAAALDFGQGVAFAAACSEPLHVRLGGRDAMTHWLALPIAHAQSLGIEGQHDRWGYRWLQPTAVLHPAHGAVPQAHARYRIDDALARGADAPLRLQIDCASQQWLAVGNRTPGLNVPFAVTMQDADGTVIAPALRTLAAEYFQCPAAMQRWTLQVDASDTAALDIVTFE